MVLRAPGTVLCAHCTRAQASMACPGCRRLACSRCLADFTTCPEPRVREIRLGMGSRLRQVDRRGHLGIFSRWYGTLQIIDLRSGDASAPAGTPSYLQLLPNLSVNASRGYRRMISLLPERRLLWPNLIHRGDIFVLDGMLCLSIDTGDLIRLSGDNLGALAENPRRQAFRIGRDEEILFARRTDERVQLINVPDLEAWVAAPFADEVIQAVFCDSTAGLLLTGTYGRVVIDEIDPAERTSTVRRGRIRIPDADIAWVAAASGRVAVLFRRSAATFLWAFALKESLVPERQPFYRAEIADEERPTALGMSGDGLMVAVAMADHTVAVHDLDSGNITYLSGHTDRVHLVEFVDDDRMLISADYDNRVLLRPRKGSDFATEIVRG